jgi:hypothetical protein
MKKQGRRSLRGILVLTAVWSLGTSLAVAALLAGLFFALVAGWITLPAHPAGSADALPQTNLYYRAAGIQTPPTLSAAAAVSVEDDAEVIGVSAGGHDRAYLVRALSAGPERHVVNDVLGNQAVSVTYCDFTDCCRTFTGGQSGKPLELDVSGWLHQGLALRVQDKDYAQATGKCLSNEGGDPLPYQEWPHQRMTWKAWRDAHPNTDLYVGVSQPLRGHPIPGGSSPGFAN